MKPSKVLIVLSALVAVLALAAAAAGLFYQDGGTPFTFTTLHGQTIQMDGQGIYRNDWIFKAPIYRGTDAVTMFILVPLLVLAILYYRRGSLSGQLMLAAMLTPFLYNGTSMAFGAAYNSIFLVYIALFSTSLFAFVLACTSIDLKALQVRAAPQFPHRATAIWMFVAGLTVFVWLIDIVSGLIEGRVPAGVASYTTDITAVIDVGIIPPTAYLTGILLLRRDARGYLLAPLLLCLNACIGLIVIGQTVMQTLAGITLAIGQYIGFVGTFVIMGFLAVWLLVRIFRSISGTPPYQPGTAQGARR